MRFGTNESKWTGRGALASLASSLLVMAIAGCGGGGGGGGIAGAVDPGDPPAVDQAGPTIQVEFPGNQAFTTADTIVLFGSSEDESAIKRVEVNGTTVTSSDGFQTWRARFTVFSGDNNFRIVAEDEHGNRSERNLTFRNDRLLPTVTDVGFDSRNLKAIVVSSPITTAEDVAFYTVDRSTGAVELLSKSGERGSGPELDVIGGMFVSGNNNRAYVTDFGKDGVYEIHLVTGDRVEISGPSRGTGPTMFGPGQLTYDSLGDRFFVCDPANGTIFVVDRSTGDRAVFSTELGAPGAIAYEIATQLIYVADRATGNVWYFDTDNAGTRGVISDSNDDGPELIQPIAMTFDDLRERLYVSDAGLGAVVQVDLGGKRTILGEIGDGEGPLEAVGGIDYDSGQDRIFMGDPALHAVLFIGSNSRTELTRSSVSDGPRLKIPRGMAYSGHGKILAINELKFNATELLAVSAFNGKRQTTKDAFGEGAGPEPATVFDIAMTASGELAYFIDIPGGPDQPRVIRLNTENGNRKVITENGDGKGESMSSPNFLATNDDGSKIWVFDFKKIVEIDAASGERKLITGNGKGGPELDILSRLAIDEAGNRLFVGWRQNIVSVDLATGNRTIVSDENDGGPKIEEFRGLVWDAVSKRVIAAGHSFSSQDVLVSINVDSGQREELSGASVGEGTLPMEISGFGFDPERRRAFVSDRRLNAVLIIDLESGDRAIISK